MLYRMNIGKEIVKDKFYCYINGFKMTVLFKNQGVEDR